MLRAVSVFARINARSFSDALKYSVRINNVSCVESSLKKGHSKEVLEEALHIANSLPNTLGKDHIVSRITEELKNTPSESMLTCTKLT